MKALFLSLIIFSIFPAYASIGVSPCFQEIMISNVWSSLPPQQIDCIIRNEEPLQGLVGLCSRDMKQLTPKFETFRRFERQYFDARERFMKATDPSEKNRQLYIIQDTETRWGIFGFRDEISGYLLMLYRVKSACESAR